MYKISYVSNRIASSYEDPPAATGSAFQPSSTTSRPSSQLHTPGVQVDYESMNQVLDKNLGFSEAPDEPSADIGLMNA